jgi:dipeptide/tripeptide permease
MVIRFADSFSGEQMNMLRDSRYGLYMGALFIPIILLGHIFPSNRSDDEFGGWILAINLATFLYFGVAGFLGVRKSQRVRDGFRMGALTAFVGLVLIISTFALLDNIFLETVSQQVDKIRGFEHSHYVSMRAYINWNHLMGVVTVLPVFVLIGAACGGIGGLLVSRPDSARQEC